MLYIIGSILLIIIDQITKYFVVEKMALYYEIPIINKVLSLTHIHNTGAAWGILSDNTALLSIITVIVLILITCYVVKRKISDNIYKTSLMLIYSGAIGNLIDRLFRNDGVIDMIKLKFIDFPVFNFADCCVVIGAILFCIYVIFRSEKEEKKNG